MDKQEKNDSDKSVKPKKHNIKLLSSFMFVCVAACVVQSEITIPVFSEVFAPLSPVATTTTIAPETTPESPTIVLPPEYSFSSVVASENDVACTFSLDNVNFEKEDYYLCLVRSEDAKDDFISSVPDLVKNIVQVKITDKTISHTFTKALSSESGVENVRPETSYAVVAVKENSIVKKEIVKTEKFIYIKHIIIDKSAYLDPYRFLYLQVTLNEKFTNFNDLYFEIYNLTLNKKEDDYYFIVNKADSKNWVHIDIELIKPVYDYELRIYCSTDNPEDIKYTTSFNHSGTNYYLIYTHPEKINF